MYAETKYLSWATHFFGKADYNLAKGGMSSVPLADIGLPAALDDPHAWDRLRNQIATFNAVDPSHVMPALGTTHALWLAYTSLVRPGDEVLVESPGYEPLWRIPEGMGASITRFTRQGDDDIHSLVARIEKQLGERTRIVVLTNLHNPSGARLATSELAAITELCSSVSATLLVDEVFSPYGDSVSAQGVWQGASAHTIADNLVAVGGLSKAFGLGALRVGWLLADPKHIRAAEHGLQSTLCEPPIAQSCLASHAFQHLTGLAKIRDQQIEGLMQQVDAWIQSQPHLSWHAPLDGPFGFVTVSGASDITRAIEHGAAEHQVLVAPGSFFGISNGFRIGWPYAHDKLAEALVRLGRVFPRPT